jgi:hypothetical protein
MFMVFTLVSLLWAAINYDTLSVNGWMQMRPTGEFPNSGGDVLGAIDTSGNFYMFGGCTYGNGAGGTHNNDIYRVDLNMGEGVLLADCSNNVWGWRGGCQAGHAFDASRNAVWVSGGAAPVCGGQNGLMKFQCPNGPFTRIADNAGGKFLIYDDMNDLLFKADQYKLHIFNPKTGQWLSDVNYPFSLGWEIYTWLVSCCFDSKRGLVVITMCDAIPNGTPRNDVYCYNGATGQWHTKTPPVKPSFTRGSLAYDPVNDLYVYFGGGTCPSELWVYSYDDNEWTQVQANGRAYNDNNPSASTWPPYRTQNTWNYSPKHDVFAVWGTTNYVSDKTCIDDQISYPFWFYKSGSLTSIARPGADRQVSMEEGLRVSPNPGAFLNIECRISNIECRSADLRIYDIKGKLVKDLSFDIRRSAFDIHHSVKWHASAHPPGIYIVRCKASGKVYQKKISLVK